jgi:hypothetical protein
LGEPVLTTSFPVSLTTPARAGIATALLPMTGQSQSIGAQITAAIRLYNLAQ